jgi:hypothetical protein
MNLEVKDIPKLLLPALKKIGRFFPFMFALIILGLYGFLILHVNQLMQVEVDDEDVEEIIRETAGLEIDRQAIEAIERLEDENIEVEAIFQEARDNPFAEAEAESDE